MTVLPHFTLTSTDDGIPTAKATVRTPNLRFPADEQPAKWNCLSHAIPLTAQKPPSIFIVHQ
jgi:hypothetical protein